MDDSNASDLCIYSIFLDYISFLNSVVCDISADDGGLHQEDATLPLESVIAITTTAAAAAATGDPTSSMIVINEDVLQLVSCYCLIVNHNLNNLHY